MILSFIAGVLVGFVVGFLVYRNNVKRFKAEEAKLTEELTQVKADMRIKLSNLKDKL